MWTVLVIEILENLWTFWRNFIVRNAWKFPKNFTKLEQLFLKIIEWVIVEKFSRKFCKKLSENSAAVSNNHQKKLENFFRNFGKFLIILMKKVGWF